MIGHRHVAHPCRYMIITIVMISIIMLIIIIIMIMIKMINAILIIVMKLIIIIILPNPLTSQSACQLNNQPVSQPAKSSPTKTDESSKSSISLKHA